MSYKPRIRISSANCFKETEHVIRSKNLKTVCEESLCPNINECWSKKHAAFMILGDICTRHCAFCSTKKGIPCNIDYEEPEKIAETVKEFNLKHVVITSVTRDDLVDGGALQFAKTVKAIKSVSSDTTVEVLIPDFQRKFGALKTVLESNPDVLNHNVETIKKFYAKIRIGANYDHSMKLLKNSKEINDKIFTKSGIMVGLGETKEEVFDLLNDLRNHNVDFITIGQYLQPSKNHYQVVEYIKDDQFKEYELFAKDLGFLMVSSSPLTRSSYNADRFTSFLAS